MSVQITFALTSNDDMSQVKIDSLSPQESLESIATYYHRLAAGCGAGVLRARTGGSAASGTVTLASMVATDTVSVRGQAFTCVASGATTNQFNVGATDTATATSLAAAINASPAMSSVAHASASGAIVTVTADANSTMGNLIALAISAHGSVSGATLSGGTNPITTSLHAGI